MKQIGQRRACGRVMPLLAVGHALLLFINWCLFDTGFELFRARWWLVFAWLWVVWPFAFFSTPSDRCYGLT